MALSDALKNAIITSVGQNPTDYGGDSALTAHTTLANALCSWCSQHVKASVSGMLGTTPTTDVLSINFIGGISVPSTFTDFSDSVKSIITGATLSAGATLIAVPTVAFSQSPFNLPQTFDNFDDAWDTIGGYIETWVTTHPTVLPFSATSGELVGTFNVVTIFIS